MDTKLVIGDFSVNLPYDTVKEVFQKIMWSTSGDGGDEEKKKLLKVLINHPSFEVLSALAHASFLEEEEFEKLVATNHVDVIRALLENYDACAKYLSEEHVLLLKNNPSFVMYLAIIVSGNARNFSNEIIQFFATHPAPEVRLEFVSESLPKKVLLALTKDKEHTVAHKALEQYNSTYS